MEILSTSPDGRYEVRSTPWEASASQWVYTPSIVNTSTGAVLYQPSDDRWSADNVTWTSASAVTLTMRRFPGNHEPAQISLSIDVCSGLIPPDTHLGENARHEEVSDDQTTSIVFP